MKGIYLLRNSSNKIVYVGKSVRITDRVRQHIGEGVKDFSSYSYIETNTTSDMHLLELMYILYLRPVLNVDCMCEDSLTLDLSSFCIKDTLDNLEVLTLPVMQEERAVRVAKEIGKRYNKLTIVKDLGLKATSAKGNKSTYVECLCDCGNTKETHLSQVVGNTVISCKDCSNKARVLGGNRNRDIPAIGTVYNSWTILEDLGIKSAHTYVKAQCRCGVLGEVSLTSLKTGKSKSCKSCAAKARHIRNPVVKREDVSKYTGTKFNDWTVLEASSLKSKISYVKAQCKCGIVKEIRLAYLKANKTKRCRSCANKALRKRKKDL